MCSLKQVPINCPGHSRPVVDLAFSAITPHGYFLVSACKDGLPMLRQGDTGDWIGTFYGHKGAVWGAAINKEGTKVATASADYSVIIWNAESGEAEQTFLHKHIVRSVDFRSDSTQLVAGSNEKLVKIFDLNQQNSEPLVELKGHTGNIKACRFISDGNAVVSASEDGTLKVWDVRNQSVVQSLTFPASPCSLEISANTSRLVLTHSNKVCFYNTDTWDLVKEFTIPTNVYAASYLPDKNIFVCGGEDFVIYRYEYSSGEELEAAKSHHFGPVHCMQFSPDGEIFASGSEDGTLRLWQTTVGKTYGLWKYDSGPAGDSDGVTTTSPPMENGTADRVAAVEG
ncbi:hypothetical protein EB796_014422 [Bugula neritina]|uniref:Serine-threonine kinase receptor-associated protein n=1 Tax=Bugula neritina TaxID=10212 RepID=A0A7J7JN28_BUGNE|nr:hypothetical protein EB796_014422 [Bugula neritina]